MTTKKNVECSLTKGITFHFQDQQRKIDAIGSLWSGYESILFEQVTVSKKRSCRLKSLHNFTIEDDKYEVEFEVISFLRGKMNCTLIKNDTHCQTLKFNTFDDKRTAFKIIFSGLAFGIIVGFVCGQFIFGA